MAGQTITHKVGDTFSWSLTYTNSAGDPGDLTGVPVDAVFVRGPSVITIQGVVTDGPAGLVDFTVDASDTESWLVGLYKGDVTFGTPLTTVFSTETFAMQVVRGYDGD